MENKQVRPTEFNKRLLVWFKKFRDISSVPEFVSSAMVEKTRNKARIGFNILCIGLACVGFGYMVRSGKKAHERGESVHLQNLAWHKKYEDEHSSPADATANAK